MKEEKSPCCAEDAPGDGCGCCCGHVHHGCDDDEGGGTRTLFRLGGALALLLVVFLLPAPEWLRAGGFAAAYLLAGAPVLWLAVRNIGRGRVFDENFLMTVASLGAFAIGEMAEAVAVMIFYGVGEFLQDAAVEKSRKNIVKLMDLRSDRATVKRGGVPVEVAPETVAVGETVVVRPGEKIPLDGVVTAGCASLDVKALTGESVPRRVCPEDEVLSGSIDQDGVLEIRVTGVFAESTVSRILDLVRHAAERKSPTEKFITRFARFYTPAVVAAALVVAVAPPLAGFGLFADWLYKALSFLIISCPCALVLSIPLSFFGGIGGAARHGILVKGGNHLDTLSRLGCIAFDKTGTLTHGVFHLTALHPASGVTEDELLRCAALAEAHSTHPIARSILAASGGVPEAEGAEVRELAGLGIECRADGETICVGNAALMRRLGIEPAESYAYTTVYVARDGRYLGCLVIADELKPGVREALGALHRAGVARLCMLTGDNRKIAGAVAAEAGIDSWRAELLPQDKLSELEEWMAEAPNGRKTAFVGDGINDAPVLSRADVGIAMGGIGSDAAIEAADVVLMTDEIGRIATAIEIAVKTKWIVWENIALALGLKAAVMLLALAGSVSVWVAIFADVGVALLAVANALRALRTGPDALAGKSSGRVESPAPAGYIGS